MSSKGRQIAKSIGKSIKRKFEADFFQFPFWLDDQQRDLIFLPTPPFNTSPQSSPPLTARKHIDPKMSIHTPKKSSSMGTIAAGESSGPGIIDHEEIIALTHDVKKFSDSLAKLKLLFTEGVEPEEDARVVIHQGLGEVLSVLNPVMQQYPALQSPDIFTAARSLITMIKDHDYETTMTAECIRNFSDAIDQLALAFSSSVSEYLMGDMGPQLVMDIRTRSMNNIATDESEEQTDDSDAIQMSSEELDGILVSLDTGLSLALQRAKVWSKYVGDIITYIEKKAQLEQDYAKNLSRLANSVQNSLKKEGFLPLQSVYCTALSQDVEFAGNLQATQAILHSHKFVEPLSVRRTEHDKVYKSVKDQWHREFRRMTDSVTNLRKAQALYMNRHQDHERALELAAKADGEKQEKRRKAQEEALHKAAEAETTYKACVAEANFRQQELFKVKADLLGRIREQIQLCDQVIKEVTIEYFQLYHTIISPLPLQYQTLSESSKSFVPGSQYAEYVRRLPGTNRPCQPEIFMFEPYIQGQKSSSEDTRKESLHSNGSVSDNHSPEGSPVTSPRRDKYRIPVKAWGQQMQSVPTSDTDSASCSSKSHESSPSGSPHRGSRRHMVSSQSLDELTEEEILAAAAHNGKHGHDRRAQLIKRTITLSGVAGDDSLDLRGLLLHGGRRNTTFGVDFQEQVDIFQTKVPPIVSKCLTEIERRGVMIKGIYRVSGVKSKVEHLCQRFDIDPEAVDLEDVHPNIISNVLKLYLRQLPEPLLTFRLYSDFIHTAKENMSGQLLGEKLTDQLRRLILRLPSSNLRTCAVLMHHLQRVAAHAETNQMSASNLGIVFGPTLLRPLEGSASLASLVDTPHQTRAIELLITHAHVIFGPSEDFQIAPSQTPVEQLSQALGGVLLPGQGRLHSQETSSKAKSSSASTEPDDLSLPVFDSSSSSASAQPSSCDFLLPGTASQDRNEIQSLAINGLDLDGSEPRSDDDDDTPDLLLPDQSKPQSDPLSVALSPRCIKVSGTDSEASHNVRAKTSPLATTKGSAANQATSAQVKPVVTKSASSPVVSRSSKSQLSSSMSVPGMGPGVDMATVLSSSAAGMAAALMMSSGSFASSEMSSSGTGQVSSTSAESTGTDGESSVSKSPQTIQESPTEEKAQQVEDGQSQVGNEKNSAEDQSKKRLHSQQLQNIKYLTKAPSVDEASSDFYPKTTFTPVPPSSSSVQNQAASEGPPLTECSEGKETAPAKESPKEEERPEALSEEATVKKEEVDTLPTSDSVQPPTSPMSSKVGSSRRSILEEMPIPTVKKPASSTTADGTGNGSEEGTVPAVTIPASPTIKRREMPSKIPTSPSTHRSAEAKQGERTDNRAERFRQEQRKLVKAIKSDAKIGAAVVARDSAISESSDTASPGPHKEPTQRYSEVFDDVFGGGCALSASSRPSSQSEESGIVVDPTAKEDDSRNSREESTLGMKKTENEKPESGQSSSQAAGQGMGVAGLSGQGSSSPVRSARTSTLSGKSVSPKLGTQGSPRQRPGGGESSPPKSAAAFGKARTLNMPSTSFMKKTTAATSGTKTVTTSSMSKTPAATSQTTKTTPSSSSGATATKSGLPGRAAGPKPTTPSGVSALKRAPSSASSDQSPQLCSRAVASMSKSSDDTSTSSKSSSPVSRKSSGRGGELAASRTAKSSSSSSSPKIEPSGSPDASLAEKSSPLPSQTSSPRHRHPSGEAGSSASARSTKQVQRKPPSSSSGTSIGSPRKIHERCQTEKPVSSSTKPRSSQGSPAKSSTARPSQLPVSPTASSPSSSPATTPTSATSKLSQDRTPRFV